MTSVVPVTPVTLPILVTSSPDNSLKQWIFDMSDGGGRELRKREGHEAPPARVRYYGGRGESIVSAGQDSSLRVFSTVADILHKSLGHASFYRKISKKHRVSEVSSVYCGLVILLNNSQTRHFDICPSLLT